MIRRFFSDFRGTVPLPNADTVIWAMFMSFAMFQGGGQIDAPISMHAETRYTSMFCSIFPNTLFTKAFFFFFIRPNRVSKLSSTRTYKEHVHTYVRIDAQAYVLTYVHS